MSEQAIRLFSGDVGRGWTTGITLTLAGLLAVVLPAAMRVRQSMNGLATMRQTYAAKLAWADHKGEIAKRLAEQQAAAAALDARLLTAADLSSFTQTIAVVARSAGCAVRSIRPVPPRVLPRPGEGKAGATAPAPGQGPRSEFVEWLFRTEIQGDYGQVSALLGRLWQHERYLRLTRLSIQACDGDREQLNCEIEIAGYGLRSPAGES